MTDPESYDERRCQVRKDAPASRILWTQEGATRPVSGWVSDIATSSIAFVTPTRSRPLVGETIELTLGAASASPQHRSVRVVRTSKYDQFFSIVGCYDAPYSPKQD